MIQKEYFVTFKKNTLNDRAHVLIITLIITKKNPTTPKSPKTIRTKKTNLIVSQFHTLSTPSDEFDFREKQNAFFPFPTLLL